MAEPIRLAPMPPAIEKRPYRVRRSAIHGRGVFATAEIPKGSRIVEYKGKRASWDEALARPDSDPTDPAHTFLFELEDGQVIDARVRGNAARWINHSCAPNCVTHEDDAGRVFIEARRRIVPGEELTYDYRLWVDGRLTRAERAQYACRCGARRCRGTLLLPRRKR
ncbi:MAG: SET domain-containing protein-lysine N-methyltransferase [Betaproteobacteria bacterium]|jgi:SET domain-containing protein|nr:SET domain-containing protein-lysine N-methyltransferase [Betaproteobacteria bacterium]MCC7217294.1 SET domain-containing protein-lysine N-methyltransferase [Burkholderiales bacterium]